MSIDLALKGRKRALAMRVANRVLIEPAKNLSDVVLPAQGSLDAGLLMVLHRGVSAERLAGKSGWSTAEVMVQVYKVVKRARLGLERRNGEMFLVYPETGKTSDAEVRELREAVQKNRNFADDQTASFATNSKIETEQEVA